MRRVTVVGSAAVLALSRAACGDDTIAVSSEKGGGTELLEAMAAAQEEAGSMRFEMTMEVMGELINGSGAASAGPDPATESMTMTMNMAGEELAMRIVDGQLYMNLPPEAGLPTDKPWLTFDPAGDDAFSQEMGGLMDQMSMGTDLQDQFVQQSDLISFEEIGSATIDGVDTTEYLMIIDFEDVPEFMDLPAEAASLLEDLTFSLWVDGGYLLRQLRSDLAGFGLMEMRFFDYGADVAVEAPPADEVADFGSIMSELMADLEGLEELEGLSDDELAELLDELESAFSD